MGHPPLKHKIKKVVTRKVDFDNQTLFHKNHISSTNGEKGDWKNLFSNDEIDLLSTRYSKWLTFHSYL